uniref:Uncharacterized protein n=1 Tax=Enterococcus faecium TaxID=1352 RepID=A3QN06_ENTFC|nr:hypothetical protein [Enterococcus faecium]
MCSRSSQEYVSRYQLLILKVDRIPFPIAFILPKKGEQLNRRTFI